MPPQLVALSDGPNISLDKPILLIGRHQECDIQIPSRKISRRHCCVAQVEDYLVVRDLYSTNGVQVNGTRVDLGTLRDGDELTIGNIRFRVTMVPRMEESQERPRMMSRDEALESCDEPVALMDDEEDAPRGAPAKKNTDLQSDDDPDPEPNAQHPPFPNVHFHPNDSSVQNSSAG